MGFTLGVALCGCGSDSEPSRPLGTGGANAAAGASGSAGASASGGVRGSPEGGRAGIDGAGTAGTAGHDPTGELFTVNAELASDVSASAPGTVGIVTWSIDSVVPESAVIEFGLDRSYGLRAPVDLTEPDYRTLLLGMKPSRAYHFRVLVTAGARTYASDDYVIETGPLTSAVAVGDLNVVDAAAYEPGFIVASYWYGPDDSVAFIVDADGDVVWWYQTELLGIARARMSEDGKNLWIVSASNFGEPLVRVSLDTLDSQTYEGTHGSHDITPVSGATMAYLEYSATMADTIVEIEPSGTATPIFDPTEYLNGSGHANALRYSQREDVYVMTDVTQDILVVNRDGSLGWRISEILADGIATLGGSQHGQHLLDDSILIFANEWGSERASAAAEYDFLGQRVWLYESGEYSSNLGDVQRLPGGNTMVTYANASIVQQVTPAGELVMQWQVENAWFGYTLWRETLYGPPPDILQ